MPGIVISYISVAEVLGVPARDKGPEELQAIQLGILALSGLTAVPFDHDSTLLTAVVKARTGLKLPDSAIVAAALLGNACALIGNDRIWKNRDLGIHYHHLDDILALN